MASSSEQPAPPSPVPVEVGTLNRMLDEVLHLEKCYETPDGLERREEVLKNLNVLVKQWIQVRNEVGSEYHSK